MSVTINKADVRTEANVGANVTSQGVDAHAGMTDGSAVNDFKSESIAGAGSQKVGIAGSLAINLVTNTTEAIYEANAAITSPGVDVSFTAENRSSSLTLAQPNEAGATADKLGFGASVAVTSIDNITRAEAEAGARLHGATPTTPFARNLTFGATSSHTAVTEAKGGASAQGDDGGAAITPVVAISVVDNVTTANVPASITNPVNITGNLGISAMNTSSVSSQAEGSADAVARSARALAWSSGGAMKWRQRSRATPLLAARR